MYLVILGFVLIAAMIWKLTGGPKSSVDKERFDSVQTAQEVLKLTQQEGGRTTVQRDVLVEMMDRLGVDREIALEELGQMGFPIEELRRVAKPEPDPRLSVVRRDSELLQEAVERALLVGIQIARVDDDYACVGDELFDPETVARQADEAEVALFGEKWRERHRLYGKAALVLQDMLQESRDEAHRSVLVQLLRVFDKKLDRLQEKLAQSMANVPDSETLMWGDGRIRRSYYFKMGVTHSLRRSGLLESFGHLYRYQGVNYNVEEAYRLAAHECVPLAVAENLGIDRLIQMGPSEVGGLVRGMLSEPGVQ
ncbi:MAG: hypothetical protein O7G87_21865 [bacterium]|nr:hypothetical protein [bacterium]